LDFEKKNEKTYSRTMVQLLQCTVPASSLLTSNHLHIIFSQKVHTPCRLSLMLCRLFISANFADTDVET